MQRSVLEQELAQKVQSIRRDMCKHDRAVLLGFIFSIIPLLPVSIIGVAVCLLNMWLYKSGKLEIYEKHMIVTGLWLGALNVVIGGAVTYYAATQFGTINWHSIYQVYLQLLNEFRNNLPLPWQFRESATI